MSVKKLNKKRRESWSMLSLRGSNVTLRQHSWTLSLGSGRMCTATILTWNWTAEYKAVRHYTNVWRRTVTTLHYKDYAAQVPMQQASVRKYCLASYPNFLLWLPSDCAFTVIQNKSRSVHIKLLLYVILFGYMCWSCTQNVLIQAWRRPICTIETYRLTISHIIKGMYRLTYELYLMIHMISHQHYPCTNLTITSKVNAPSTSISNGVACRTKHSSAFSSSLTI